MPSADCNVEFVYLWPNDKEDKRRWLAAISRSHCTEQANLHTHPVPPASKLPSQLKSDWKSAVIANPTTKTHSLMMGEYSLHAYMQQSGDSPSPSTPNGTSLLITHGYILLHR